jgi:hypothetical protein
LKLDIGGAGTTGVINTSAYGSLGAGNSNHSGLQSPLQIQNSTYESSIATQPASYRFGQTHHTNLVHQ